MSRNFWLDKSWYLLWWLLVFIAVLGWQHYQAGRIIKSQHLEADRIIAALKER